MINSHQSCTRTSMIEVQNHSGPSRAMPTDTCTRSRLGPRWNGRPGEESWYCCLLQVATSSGVTRRKSTTRKGTTGLRKFNRGLLRPCPRHGGGTGRLFNFQQAFESKRSHPMYICQSQLNGTEELRARHCSFQ